tara:strand:- start:801 stop:1046 length:246 start_codon:yes stop_codon:yes gene_type:complete
MKNYKALKAAAKVTLEKVDDTKYKITKKVYDPETGEALADVANIEYTEFLDGIISGLGEHIAEKTAEKEDWELLKEDLEAL